MSAFRRWVIGLCTVAFLVAQLTGAHLHLCLDGSEPLAELHVSDTAEEAHHHDPSHHTAVSATIHADAHDDVDLDAIGSALAKVVKLDLSALALIAWCLAFLYVAFVRQPVPAVFRQPDRPPLRYLRPLLRAPPF